MSDHADNESGKGGWIEFRLGGPLSGLEVFADFLSELGSSGAIFSEDPERPGGDLVTVFLPREQSSADVVSSARSRAGSLGKDFPGAWTPLAVTEVVDRDWNREWRESLEPLEVASGIWVTPTFKPVPKVGPDDVVIRFDPGMAFGTGRHPTTRMCVEELTDRLRAGGGSVLDLGTGSGILAMVAAKLGAVKVVGMDIDPHALAVAKENLEINGLAGEVKLVRGVSDSEEIVDGGPFDIIAANLFAEALAKLAGFLVRNLNPKGTLVLSGILAERESLLNDALCLAKIAVTKRREEEGWVALVARSAAAEKN